MFTQDFNDAAFIAHDFNDEAFIAHDFNDEAFFAEEFNDGAFISQEFNDLKCSLMMGHCLHRALMVRHLFAHDISDL